MLHGLCVKGTAKQKEKEREGIIKTRFKLLYHTLEEHAFLRIAHPTNNHAPVTDIKLKPYQVVVLPYKYKYVSNTDFNAIDVHDIISLLFGWIYVN